VRFVSYRQAPRLLKEMAAVLPGLPARDRATFNREIIQRLQNIVDGQSLTLPGTFNEFLAQYFNGIKRAGEADLTPEQARAKFDAMKDKKKKEALREEAADNYAPFAERRAIKAIRADKTGRKLIEFINAHTKDEALRAILTVGINNIVNTMDFAAKLSRKHLGADEKYVLLAKEIADRLLGSGVNISREDLLVRLGVVIGRAAAQGFGLVDIANIAAHAGWNITHPKARLTVGEVSAKLRQG